MLISNQTNFKEMSIENFKLITFSKNQKKNILCLGLVKKLHQFSFNFKEKSIEITLIFLKICY